LITESLIPARADFSELSIAELRRLCNEYFVLLDSDEPPECLLVDYQAACEELSSAGDQTIPYGGNAIP
jgi:hypothetical protein